MFEDSIEANNLDPFRYKIESCSCQQALIDPVDGNPISVNGSIVLGPKVCRKCSVGKGSSDEPLSDLKCLDCYNGAPNDLGICPSTLDTTVNPTTKVSTCSEDCERCSDGKLILFVLVLLNINVFQANVNCVGMQSI